MFHVHVLEFWTLFCSTLKELIDNNSRKNFDDLHSIYTLDQLHYSERLHGSWLSCKVQFSENVTSFPATMTQ